MPEEAATVVTVRSRIFAIAYAADTLSSGAMPRHVSTLSRCRRTPRRRRRLVTRFAGAIRARNEKRRSTGLCVSRRRDLGGRR